MVIKDFNGKIKIILDNRDLIEYIIEKCGVEVGIEIESIFKKADESLDKDNCDGCECLDECKDTNDELEWQVNELTEKLDRLQEDKQENEKAYINKINRLEKQYEQLKEEKKNQKEIYIEYLRSCKAYAAVKLLQNFEG